jgi:hypothetical protein
MRAGDRTVGEKMKRKLIIATIMTALALTIMPEALRQLRGLKCVAAEQARLGLRSGLATIVYAHDDSRAKSTGDNNATEDDFRWQGRIAQGRAIEIKGVSGEVRAEATSGDQVEVVAHKTARRSDPAGVRLQVVEHAGGITICAVYPNTESGKPNECKPGGGGHMSVHNNDVSVNFTVRVPQGVRFIGRNVNGGVEARSIGGDVEAYTVNGGVNISAAGNAQAKTVNGSINASVGDANWTSKLEFETVNGSITLDLPAQTSTELEAETVNGDISTDFPLTVQGRFGRRHVSGTIGSGGRELQLATVNGDIRVRRAQ